MCFDTEGVYQDVKIIITRRKRLKLLFSMFRGGGG